MSHDRLDYEDGEMNHMGLHCILQDLKIEPCLSQNQIVDQIFCFFETRAGDERQTLT